jgi:sugar phosphate isomerase/epimerase
LDLLIMYLGIFAKTFSRRTFAETLDAVASHGFSCIQFNFSCVGLPTVPASVEPGAIAQICKDCDARGISIAGVSGTFNMIDPDVRNRRERLGRLSVLAQATRELGCDLITLCTGTRDPDDMWRAHPDNNSPAAWRDLLGGMEEAIAIAEQHDVLLGVEPETANVVSSARKARQLLDELHSSRVKIVIDPANLFHPGKIERMCETIEEVFQLVGPDIVMAHAKELGADGATGRVAPGRGVLDWNLYFATLARMDFRGPMVLHGLAEADVAEAARFLRAKLWE